MISETAEDGVRPDGSIEPHPEGREAVPCSLAQQRMWLLEQLGDATYYNVAFALRFSGRFDQLAAAQAVTELVRRHEMLRTTFEQRAGQLLQLIHPAGEVRLPGPVDLSGEPDATATLDLRVQASLTEPFDLRREVVRFTLYQLAGAGRRNCRTCPSSTPITANGTASGLPERPASGSCDSGAPNSARRGRGSTCRPSPVAASGNRRATWARFPPSSRSGCGTGRRAATARWRPRCSPASRPCWPAMPASRSC